ncbi:MAG: helix-turn-helix domain-containing protein [Succinivibrionaceae bacterium]
MDRESIQKLTRVLGLTYQELADESGYSVKTIESYMSGARKPSLKIEDFLRTRLKEQFENGDETLKFIIDVLCK